MSRGGSNRSKSMPRASKLRQLTESDIEMSIMRASVSGCLEFNNSNLLGDLPLFIADAILAHHDDSSSSSEFIHFEASQCEISTHGFKAITEGLIEAGALESFIARGNALSKESGVTLSKLLSADGHLQLLDISSNKLGDIGISSLATALGNDVSRALLNKDINLLHLQVMNLSQNGFGDSGILGLCRGLTQLVKHAAAIGIQPALKVLQLHGNLISDKGANCLAQVICSQMDTHEAISFKEPPSTLRSTSSTPNRSALQLAESYASSAAKAAVVGRSSPGRVQSRSRRLQLEELGLNDNPNLTVKGVMMLLGSVREGRFCPLRRLHVARVKATTAVLEQLAINLRYSHGMNWPLEVLDMELTRVDAEEVINNSIMKFGRLEASLLGNSLSGAMKKLADALLNLNHDNRVSLQRIALGALHQSIYERCVAAEIGVKNAQRIMLQSYTSAEGTAVSKRNGTSSAQYQETMRALEAMNPIASILGIPYVADLPEWVRSNNYFNKDLFSTPPAMHKNPSEAMLTGLTKDEGDGHDDGRDEVSAAIDVAIKRHEETVKITTNSPVASASSGTKGALGDKKKEVGGSEEQRINKQLKFSPTKQQSKADRNTDCEGPSSFLVNLQKQLQSADDQNLSNDGNSDEKKETVMYPSSPGAVANNTLPNERGKDSYDDAISPLSLSSPEKSPLLGNQSSTGGQGVMNEAPKSSPHHVRQLGWGATASGAKYSPGKVLEMQGAGFQKARINQSEALTDLSVEISKLIGTASVMSIAPAAMTEKHYGEKQTELSIIDRIKEAIPSLSSPAEHPPRTEVMEEPDLGKDTPMTLSPGDTTPRDAIDTSPDQQQQEPEQLQTKVPDLDRGTFQIGNDQQLLIQQQLQQNMMQQQIVMVQLQQLANQFPNATHMMPMQQMQAMQLYQQMQNLLYQQQQLTFAATNANTAGSNFSPSLQSINAAAAPPDFVPPSATAGHNEEVITSPSGMRKSLHDRIVNGLTRLAPPEMVQQINAANESNSTEKKNEATVDLLTKRLQEVEKKIEEERRQTAQQINDLVQKSERKDRQHNRQLLLNRLLDSGNNSPSRGRSYDEYDGNTEYGIPFDNSAQRQNRFSPTTSVFNGDAGDVQAPPYNSIDANNSFHPDQVQILHGPVETCVEDTSIPFDDYNSYNPLPVYRIGHSKNGATHSDVHSTNVPQKRSPSKPPLGSLPELPIDKMRKQRSQRQPSQQHVTPSRDPPRLVVDTNRAGSRAYSSERSTNSSDRSLPLSGQRHEISAISQSSSMYHQQQNMDHRSSSTSAAPEHRYATLRPHEGGDTDASTAFGSNYSYGSRTASGKKVPSFMRPTYSISMKKTYSWA